MKHLPDQKKLDKDLNKREQELKCLYKIALEAGRDNDLEQMLQSISEHLRQGLQYPDISFASIQLDGMEYSSRPIPREKVLAHFSSDLVIGREKRGSISVYYGAGGEFLREEEELIKAGGGSGREGRGAAAGQAETVCG